MRDLVYVSYSPCDREQFEELHEILDGDVRLKDIVWDASQVAPGANVREETDKHLARTKVMVILVGPEYLQTDSATWQSEALPALDASQGEPTVLWIPVRAVETAETRLDSIQPVIEASRPLSGLTGGEREECLMAVRDAVLRAMGKEESEEFDVFLSYNRADQAAVREIAEELKKRGLKVWFDEWELRPGERWQDRLEEVIETTRSAAIFVGPKGVGPWEDVEKQALLDEFVKRRLRVIPVLLPGAGETPKLPLFLRGFNWVDLRGGLNEQGIEHLVWGITGRVRAAPLPPTPYYLLAVSGVLAFGALGAFWLNRHAAAVFASLAVGLLVAGMVGAVARTRDLRMFSRLETAWGQFGCFLATVIPTMLILLGLAEGPGTTEVQGIVNSDDEPAEIDLKCEAFEPTLEEVAAKEEIEDHGGKIDYYQETKRIEMLDLTGVKVGGELVGDEQVRDWLRAIDKSRLKELDLSETDVTNDVLLEVAKLRTLRILALNECRGIDGPGLAHLSEMTELEQLDLSVGEFEEMQKARLGAMDAYLIKLAKLTNLKVLDLSFTDTGPGLAKLAKLAKLKELTELRLEFTNVDNANLAVLAKYDPGDYLQILDLSRIKNGDAALESVADFDALQRINLIGTTVTPEGLNSLTGLKHLNCIDLTGTDIPRTETDKLRAKFEQAVEIIR